MMEKIPSPTEVRAIALAGDLERGAVLSPEVASRLTRALLYSNQGGQQAISPASKSEPRSQTYLDSVRAAQTAINSESSHLQSQSPVPAAIE